jgi:hypothetical protein
MQNRNAFQILKRNENNTIRIEYLQTVYADISMPTDELGNELRGKSLIDAVTQVVLDKELKNINENHNENDKDPNIDEELELLNISSRTEDSVTGSVQA